MLFFALATQLCLLRFRPHPSTPACLAPSVSQTNQPTSEHTHIHFLLHSLLLPASFCLHPTTEESVAKRRPSTAPVPPRNNNSSNSFLLSSSILLSLPSFFHPNPTMVATTSHVRPRPRPRLRPPPLFSSLRLLLTTTALLLLSLAPCTTPHFADAQLTMDMCAYTSDCVPERRCIAIDGVLSLLDMSTTSSSMATPLPVSALASVAMDGTPCEQSSASNCTCLPQTLSLCTTSAQCATHGERCVRFPGLLLDDAVCVSCTAMDYVTHVPVDVAVGACDTGITTVQTTIDATMTPSVEEEGAMMSHEPDDYSDDMMMPSTSSDSTMTMMYETLPHDAVITPLMNDGAPLVLASSTPDPAAIISGGDVDSDLAVVPVVMVTATMMMETPMDTGDDAPQASASPYMSGPGPTMTMDGTMTEPPAVMDDGDNQVGLAADLMEHGDMPMTSAMPMAALPSSEYDSSMMTAAAATDEAFIDGVVSGTTADYNTAMYWMSAEPSSSSSSAWRDEEEEEDDMMTMTTPHASDMPMMYMEPTTRPMTSSYIYNSHSVSITPTPIPTAVYDDDDDEGMTTVAPSVDSDMIGLPVNNITSAPLLPTTTVTTLSTTIPVVTAVMTASATMTVTASATATLTVIPQPDVSATVTMTASSTTTVTSSTTVTVTSTTKWTTVPTTKVTTLPNDGGDDNEGWRGVGELPPFLTVPEVSAMPTPDVVATDMYSADDPTTTTATTTTGYNTGEEDNASNVDDVDPSSDTYGGGRGVMKSSPEVEMSHAYGMMMKKEEEVEVVATPNTYTLGEESDSTTTTTTISSGNNSSNEIGENDMGTVTLTDMSPTTSKAAVPTTSPDLLDDTVDDVDDANDDVGPQQQPPSSSSITPSPGSVVNSDSDSPPLPMTPEVDEEEVCVDARLLTHLPASDLVYGDQHRRAAVLCDDMGSCATAGHMVRFRGEPMSMRSYCLLRRAVARCVRRVSLVNSPRYKRVGGVSVASKTKDLEFSAHAARFATGMEEWVLRKVMKMGL